MPSTADHSSVHEAELFTVGPREVVVTFATDTDRDVTTVVGDHEVVTSGRFHVARIHGLDAGTTYPLRVEGAEPSPLLPPEVTTLTPPPGALVASFATVNDVHFGETECGKLGTPEEIGPVLSAEPGAPPYPEVMNRAAIAEMAVGAFDAVLVKGDLTDRGTEAEYEQFLAAYTTLGDRMHHVRGNHDAMVTTTIASAHAPFEVRLRGARLAVLDTTVPGIDRGHVPSAQLDWLDALAAGTSDPVFVFGHHHPWDPASHARSASYFGINPDDSVALCAVFARHANIVGYFAGHTHRNRVRHFESAREIPIVEIACVKDYPGAWAEYQVYEGGYVQLVRRISGADAMAWTEKTRHMFGGAYRDYALGSITDRCFSVAF